jgi:hypothetical protein
MHRPVFAEVDFGFALLKAVDKVKRVEVNHDETEEKDVSRGVILISRAFTSMPFSGLLPGRAAPKRAVFDGFMMLEERIIVNYSNLVLPAVLFRCHGLVTSSFSFMP